MGSMLTGDETTAQIARRYFGPVLLQEYWIHETGFEQSEALRTWGQLETVYRLVAIIIVQCIISSGLIVLFRRRNANHTPDGIRQPADGSPKPSV